jgi:hypothetical protein
MSDPHVSYERGPRRESLSVARHFLLFLRERGVIPQIAGADSLACPAPLLQPFQAWMLEQRGVTRVAEEQQATDLALLRKLESKYRTPVGERDQEPQIGVPPVDQTPVTPIQGSLF